MKQIKFIVSLILLALTLIFIACEQEWFGQEEDDTSMSVEEARAWFENNQPEFLVLKSANPDKKTKVIQPDWKSAFKSRNDKVEVVETSVLSNGLFGFVTKESREEWLSGGDSGYLVSLTRLVVLHYKKSDRMVSFFMTIIGDKTYLGKKEFKLWDNTYLTKDKDFNGMVLFHNTEGKFINGWRYTEGKITHTLTVNFEQETGIQLKSGHYDCSEHIVYEWFIDCTDYYTVGEIDGQIVSISYTGTSCGTPYMDYAGTSIECTYVDDGLGNGGGYVDPSNSLNTILNSLFVNGVNLTEDQIQLLNSAFNEMEQDCKLHAITNYLTANNISLGEISINVSLPQTAYVDGNGNLTFAGDWAITTEVLSHEWFHLGQKKMNNVSFSDGYAEFEAWLFFDILETIKVGGDFASSNHQFACYKSYTSTVEKRDYQNWLLSITKNGTAYPAYNTMGFYEFGPIFGNVRDYDSLDFSNTSYQPETMFNLFRTCIE